MQHLLTHVSLLSDGHLECPLDKISGKRSFASDSSPKTRRYHMMATHSLDDTDQHILWACYACLGNRAAQFDEALVCYSWARERYMARFDGLFHQSRLDRLAKLGFLEKDISTRGGKRRYYKIVDPDRVQSLLQGWSLN